MLVSVVIATYGEESWADLAITRALPSAEAEEPHEVLVGHDPETDSIAKVRNWLATKAEGDWLLFLDADDEIAPGYLRAMKRALGQKRGGDGPPLLLTPAVSYIRNGKKRTPMFHPTGDLQNDNYLVVGTLIEKTLFEQVGGFSDYPHGFEDWSLWYKAAKLGAKVVQVPRAVYIAHWNPDSKHKRGWKDRRWQVAEHKRIQAELEAWIP